MVDNNWTLILYLQRCECWWWLLTPATLLYEHELYWIWREEGTIAWHSGNYLKEPIKILPKFLLLKTLNIKLELKLCHLALGLIIFIFLIFVQIFCSNSCSTPNNFYLLPCWTLLCLTYFNFLLNTVNSWGPVPIYCKIILIFFHRILKQEAVIHRKMCVAANFCPGLHHRLENAEHE